jgi:hypothetical protein
MNPTADEAAAIVAALRAILSRRPAQPSTSVRSTSYRKTPERSTSRWRSSERSTSRWRSSERSTFMVDRRGHMNWRTTARQESISSDPLDDADRPHPRRDR